MNFFCRCVFSAALLCGSLHAATEFKIGPDSKIDSLSVAASATNYLVVWRDVINESAPRIYGSTVTGTGVASPAFAISDVAGLPIESPVQRITVAFDGNNFLVVWADNRAVGFGVRGAIVTPAGVVSVPDFLIAPISRNTEISPLVVFTGTDFLVAWQDASQSALTTATQIYYSRVTTAGLPGLVSALPAPSQDQRLEFLIAGANSEGLIVFQNVASDPDETLATRINADNSINSLNNNSLLFVRDFSAIGYGAPLGAAFVDNEYVILSSYSAQIDSSVFKTRIRADGRVIRPSSPFAEVGQGKTALTEDDFPRTVYNGNGEFLFVRNTRVSDTAYHLYAKRVLNDGTDRDPNVPIIDTAAQGVLNGATAAAVGSQYLVVWMDGRSSNIQPARQINVFGLIIDGSKDGDETLPFLKAVARAAPIIGNSPLVVAFGTAGSGGIVDSVKWDFGDGGTDDIGSTTHTYKEKGDYLAVLSIDRAGYTMHDFVRILVDSNVEGGLGGPPQVVGGSLGPVSAGVNPDIFITDVSAALNYTLPNSDSVRFFGYIDPSVIPVSVKDVPVSLDFASKHYEFKLRSDGLYIPESAAKPVMRFTLNRFNGAFLLTVNQEDLATMFAGLGAGNETVTKPGKDIAIPVVFKFGSLSYTATLTMNYTAKAGMGGRAQYYFTLYGSSDVGFFRIFGAKVTETGKATKAHNFIVTGNMGFGSNTKLVKADTGNWRVTIGNYVQDIPVASIQRNGDVYTYKKKTAVGLDQFFYNTKNGAFGFSFKNVPAEGIDPSGMPVSTSQFSRADMALSIDWDLAGNTKFQASGFLRLFRQKAESKKWKLR